MVKSRRMGWAEHVACMVIEKVHTGFWWRKLRERDNFEDLILDWKIILKGIFKKWNGLHGLD
jgi:hypothetical protein